MDEIKAFVDETGKTLGYIDERPGGLLFAFKTYEFPDGLGREFLSMDEAEEYLRV